MANPFPGMDPYLEDSFWQSVHANLASEITRYLAPRVRPKYAVVTTERVVLSGWEDSDDEQIRLPDVGVLTAQPLPGPMAAEDLAWVEERLRAAGRG